MTTIGFAVLAGVGVLLAGTLLWGALLPVNFRAFPVVPWAIVPMAAYLWIYWKFIGGAIGSPHTALQRRDWLRANAVSIRVWAMALLSGLIGYAALLTLLAILARLTTLPASAPIAMPAEMPAITALLLLVMSAVVAGVTEEAGFRGYMLGPIERRYGLLPAILVTGIAFGLLHFPNHPNQVWTMLPYYIAVSAVYGGMTSASNSILPAVVLHAIGNVWSLTRLWTTGRPEWQIVANPGPLVWATGVDTAFLILAGAFVLFAAATWASCLATARLARADEARRRESRGEKVAAKMRFTVGDFPSAARSRLGDSVRFQHGSPTLALPHSPIHHLSISQCALNVGQGLDICGRDTLKDRQISSEVSSGRLLSNRDSHQGSTVPSK